MSPIAPGTLCIIVGDADAKYLGRCITVIARTGEACRGCGADLYQLNPFPGFAETFACRAVLKPILPPGIDVNSTANEDLKVPA